VANCKRPSQTTHFGIVPCPAWKLLYERYEIPERFDRTVNGVATKGSTIVTRRTRNRHKHRRRRSPRGGYTYGGHSFLGYSSYLDFAKDVVTTTGPAAGHGGCPPPLPSPVNSSTPGGKYTYKNRRHGYNGPKIGNYEYCWRVRDERKFSPKKFNANTKVSRTYGKRNRSARVYTKRKRSAYYYYYYYARHSALVVIRNLYVMYP